MRPSAAFFFLRGKEWPAADLDMDLRMLDVSVPEIASVVYAELRSRPELEKAPFPPLDEVCVCVCVCLCVCARARQFGGGVVVVKASYTSTLSSYTLVA
jgi:hypothetical protein